MAKFSCTVCGTVSCNQRNKFIRPREDTFGETSPAISPVSLVRSAILQTRFAKRASSSGKKG